MLELTHWITRLKVVPDAGPPGPAQCQVTGQLPPSTLIAVPVR